MVGPSNDACEGGILPRDQACADAWGPLHAVTATSLSSEYWSQAFNRHICCGYGSPPAISFETAFNMRQNAQR